MLWGWSVWKFGWCWPCLPGHPLRASLRWLASPSLREGDGEAVDLRSKMEVRRYPDFALF